MKYELTFCIIIVFTLLAVTSAKGTILITEVFYDTSGTESDEEWIELYNPTSSDINIDGYVIEDNTITSSGNYYQVSAGKTIPAKDAIIIARSTTGFRGLGYDFDPYIDDFDLGLNNGGDFLILRDAPGGNQIDMVAWEGKVTGWDIEASTDKSIRRISFGSGPSAWASNQTSNPGSPAPLPEPSTFILLGSGLIGLIAILYRRKQR